jgi:hypothetical protein
VLEAIVRPLVNHIIGAFMWELDALEEEFRDVLKAVTTRSEDTEDDIEEA